MRLPSERAYSLIILFATMATIVFLVRMNLQAFLPFFQLRTTAIVFRFIIGATVVALLHHLVGTNNYGFFAPLVLSLAPIAAGLYWGTIIILTIISVAILVRFTLEPFNLPIGFRLSIIILFDTITMALLAGIGGIQHINELTLSFIAPILIIAWLGERYVRTTQEHDWYDANIRLFWTVIVTILATTIMGDAILIQYLMSNPETWLLVLALNLLVGLKVKTRLSEYFRFRSFFRRKGNAPDEPDLDEAKPLTMDRRNRDYIGKYNLAQVFARINKIGLKEIFREHDIPHAPTILMLQQRGHLDQFDEFLQHEKIDDGFVIKPANSYGGNGILLVEGRDDGVFRGSGGRVYSKEDLVHHCRRILDGEFLVSFSHGNRDIALIERRIIPDARLEGLYYEGLPDIRVIVFRGVPILAMTRLPTWESQGKANLKQGAVGAAINLSEGRIYHAIFKGLSISRHPDTGREVIGFQIPAWESILELASRAQAASGLGIAGVDAVIDRSLGPLILEVNKRPGMEIQNITGRSLLRRLELLEEILPPSGNLTPREGIELVKRLEAEGWRTSGS